MVDEEFFFGSVFGELLDFGSDFLFSVLDPEDLLSVLELDLFDPDLFDPDLELLPDLDPDLLLPPDLDPPPEREPPLLA